MNDENKPLLEHKGKVKQYIRPTQEYRFPAKLYDNSLNKLTISKEEAQVKKLSDEKTSSGRDAPYFKTSNQRSGTHTHKIISPSTDQISKEQKVAKDKKARLVEKRELKICNFKNLNVGSSNSKRQESQSLLINRSMNRNEVGGLVIILGLNNTGKSNVLTAIERWRLYRVEYGAEDIPDFEPFENIRPELKMIIGKGYRNAEEPKSVREYLCSNNAMRNSDGKINPVENLQEPLLELYKALDKQGTVFSTENKIHIEKAMRLNDSKYVLPSPVQLSDNIPYLDSSSRYIELESSSNSRRGHMVPQNYEGYEILIRKQASVLYNSLKEDANFRSTFGDTGKIFLSSIESLSKGKETPELKKLWNEVCTDTDFIEKYGYSPYSRVYKFEWNPTKKIDLDCKPNGVSDLFDNIFSAYGEELDTVKECYSKKGSSTKLRHIEKNINEALKSESQNFNKLFASDEKNQYKFTLRLEEESLKFFIERGDIDLVRFERQSEGFRWMFDFYMNFLNQNEFMPGDIILIDEFGQSLNAKTTREVTASLRKWGREKGITIIIATQNFMSVDLRHLDEVRLVINKPSGSSHILNQFDNFDNNDHDVLRPILDTLTVGRNYMKEKGMSTLFVEGVTDYFVLTSFANKIYEGEYPIQFLPINGLGHSIKKKTTIDELCKIETFPSILVDSDDPGRNFKEMSKGRIDVKTLSDLTDGEINEIEDLFNEEDMINFNLETRNDNNGRFNRYATFAQNLDEYYDQVSMDARTRISALLEKIKESVESRNNKIISAMANESSTTINVL